MNRLLASVLLGLALAVVSASGAWAQPIRIVAFGGSSTYGQGVERYDAFPAKLEKALRAKGYDVAVTNAGVSGDKTADGLARLDRVVPAGTQIVIVEYGVNDSYAKIDPATTRANLDTMLGRLRAKGAQVMLLGYRGSQGLDAVAQKYDAKYSDFGFPGAGDAKYRIANDPQLRTSGVAHFNAAGYDMIVTRILPSVEELIARVRR
jgi:acyl-CoA thioesterase I